MVKKLYSLLAVLALLAGLAAAAYAHEIPDLSRNGSITLTMDWEGTPLDSGKLSICKVGEILYDEPDWSFVLVEQLKDSGLSLADIDDPDLPRKIANQALQKSLPWITAEIKGGKAVFVDVTPGLYVVRQDAQDACDGFAPINPFLISMPKYENEKYQYEIVANPKVPLETEPPETTLPEPTKPTDPELPQTGQLNWPVPVMAVCGMLLFLVGWKLRFGKCHET